MVNPSQGSTESVSPYGACLALARYNLAAAQFARKNASRILSSAGRVWNKICTSNQTLQAGSAQANPQTRNPRVVF